MAGTDNRRLLATGKDTQLFSEETDSTITFITDSAEGSNTYATLEKNKVQPQTVKKIVDLWKQNEYITRESNITIKNQATMPSPRIVTPEFCYLTGLSDSLRLQVTSSRIYDFGQETIEEDGIIINASLFPAENYHHRNRYDIHDCDDCYLGIGRFTQYYTYHRESNGYPDIANGYRGPMYLCGEAALLSFFFDFFEKEWNLLIWPDAKLRYVPIYEDEKDILREIAQTANKNVESIENTTFEEAYKQFWEGKGNSSSDLQHIQNLKKDLPDWFLKKSIFDYEQRTIEKWVNESYPQSQQEYRKNLCDFINSVVQALKQTCNYLSDGFYYKEPNDINDTPYYATMTMHDSKGPVTWIAKRHVTSASTASFREKSHHHFVWFDNYAEAKEYCDAHTCK